MNRKNIFVLLVALIFVSTMYGQAQAASVMPQKNANVVVSVQSDDKEECDETELIKRFSLRDRLKKTPENQIRDFYKRYNRYSAKNRIDKLKEMYTENYVNNDGFNKNTVFEMMNLASDSYKDVVYNTELEKIIIDGNYAVVTAKEIASGSTEKPLEKVNDIGSINSELHFVNHMKKEGNKWKISATEIVYEKVILAYGETKNVPIDISAPDCVAAGSEYDVTLKTTTPENSFIVASITNDRIVFPQEQTKDVYRPVKKTELSRILKANTTNNNEYATASIALTKVKTEPSSIVLNMSGIAFVMKRVNVLSVNENIKINKEILNAKTTTHEKTSK